ncbi:hypothetical protein J8281_04915 [Aquimarina sp. U1-2]|uniref:hypothetical protein n=1 Tax=Aquimarina sp. U1-2 TaxID=2823141 RepID=UPI001AECDC5E|nr:hypothetical protein [Aquimarina sp. U1-2]MBP2831522.1 hypothetical protein [Aquimarina sp. U1-2]
MGKGLKKINFSNFKRFLSESILIVFSVLFALFINQCQNEAQEEKRTISILKNIKSELENNRKSAQRLVNYHSEVIKKLEITDSDSLESKFFRGSRFVIWDNDIIPRGISQEIFKDIAWQTAEQEDISSRISFDKAQVLFEAYSQQKMVNKTINTFIRMITQRETHRRELIHETVAIMQQLVTELKSQEKALVYRLDEALKVLE